MGLLVRLKVHPGSRRERVERRSDTRYELWVRAEAEAGKANAAALALLARAMGVEAKRLRIARGASTPSKLVEVLGS